MLTRRWWRMFVPGFGALWCAVGAPTGVTLAESDQSADPGASGAGDRFTWGFVWYLNGRLAYDDVTLVEGGVRGSAMLVIQDPGSDRTRWIMLDGEEMWLRRGNGTPIPVAVTPGHEVISERKSGFRRNAQPADTRELTTLLVQLCERAGRRHAPFLDNGWNGTKGATLAEARLVASRMGLNLAISENSDGRVKSQDPPGGRPMSAGDTLTVALDGVVPPVVSPPVGNTPDTAIDLKCGANPAAVSVDLRYTNALPPLAGIPDGVDVFFKLDPANAGKTVTLRRVNATHAPPAVAMSAWRTDPSNPLHAAPVFREDQPDTNWDYGLTPELTFSIPSGATDRYYIVVDVIDAASGDLHFEFSCAP